MTTHFVEMDVILLRCSTRKILRWYTLHFPSHLYKWLIFITKNIVDQRSLEAFAQRKYFCAYLQKFFFVYKRQNF